MIPPSAMTGTPQVVGYDVVYNYRNEDFHDRMNHDPGPQAGMTYRA